MSLSTVQFNREKFNVDLDEIKQIVDLPDWKIHNVYMYGSRVYGTYHSDSDYDFLVVANSLEVDREIRSGKYNIHVHTPDKFEDDLRKFQMVNLECVFAPSFANLQEKKPYEMMEYDEYQFKRSVFKQSHNAWMKAQFKFREMDMERATKSLFHSLRILLFGLQVVDEKGIFDFSEANYYWEEITDMEEFKWNVFKKKFLPLKKDLEKMLMQSKKGDV